jgi:ribonuclease Z
MEVVFGSQLAKVGVSLNLLESGRIFEDDHFAVIAFPVQHRGEGCFGFTFEERSHRPFLAEQAEALGIPHGPVRRDLAAGQAVVLSDGRAIHPDQVLAPPQRGAKLCFIGDVSHTGPLHAEVEGADLLAIEATYLETEKEMARQHGHLTAAMAARLARNAHVKFLVLHHVSRRYQTHEILAEAQAIFPNTVVAADLDHFRASKDKPVAVSSLRG